MNKSIQLRLILLEASLFEIRNELRGIWDEAKKDKAVSDAQEILLEMSLVSLNEAIYRIKRVSSG